MLSKDQAILQMNQWGAEKRPFWFLTDFTGDHIYISSSKQSSEVALSFHESGNPNNTDFSFEKFPKSLSAFQKQFDEVIDQIRYGNSFLVNLTLKTPIRTNLTLRDIFDRSRARYKVLYRDHFTCFSPETFVKTAEGYLYSHPMKGTIDVAIPDAAQVILNDPKEMAEHITIVDLIRNDLSQICDEVTVTRFRYIDKVITHEKSLLQVSSEIRGRLPDNWQTQLGTLLFQLLPAGSISGAPKAQTLHIIESAEDYQRGFYTGICGHFDGKELDTGVMIRFIEKEGDQLYFKSGGGVTSFSNLESEYQEIIDKIYVPVY